MKRDLSLDAARGIAVILVVIGHVFQFTIIDFYNLPVFNFIWSVQIPLFMILSGFFGKPVEDRKFLREIKKCFFSYMLPVITDLYLVRTLLLQRSEGSLWQATLDMQDSLKGGLWFLFALFFLQIALKFALTFIRQIDGARKAVCLFIVYGIEIVPFFIIAIICGSSFWGVKYILYYSVFICLGAVLKMYWNRLIAVSSNFKERFAFLIGCAYIFILGRVNLYTVNDSLLGISLRVFCGGVGSALIIMCCYRWKEGMSKKFVGEVLGRYSLEIYIAHVLFVKNFQPVSWGTPESFLTMMLELLILMVCSFFYIKIIKMNRVANLLFFGKNK